MTGVRETEPCNGLGEPENWKTKFLRSSLQKCKEIVHLFEVPCTENKIYYRNIYVLNVSFAFN